jgi:glutamate 5-kinase
VDGLYTADPNKDSNARLIEQVTQITPQIETMAGGSASTVGSGGMATKIAAARIATGAGCLMCIAAGDRKHPLQHIEQGGACTWFMPASTPDAARKQWIAGTLRPAGALRIDAGALRALNAGKSLLPAGVTGTQGCFDSGDTVSVIRTDGLEVARGIAGYSDAETARIMGHRSSEIELLLGYRGREELIHRDDLVIIRRE